MLSRRRDDAGFTLIELVLAVAIVGVIAVALAGIAIQYFKVSASAATRLNESTDQQFVSAYWQQDVSSLGMHEFKAGVSDPVLERPSVWTPTTSAPTALVPTACTMNLPGTLVAGFAWDDYAPGPQASTAWDVTRNAVAYVAQQNGLEWQLYRIRCVGTAPSTSQVVARHLAAPPSVECRDTSGGSLPCDATGPFPAVVNLNLDVLERDSTGPTSTTGYHATLSAQRRQG